MVTKSRRLDKKRVECQKCHQRHLECHKFYFACLEDDCLNDDLHYTICRACAHGNKKPLTSKCHEHSLKRFPANFDKKWTCKAKNCLSGMTGKVDQCVYNQGYYCSQGCKFYAC